MAGIQKSTCIGTSIARDATIMRPNKQVLSHEDLRDDKGKIYATEPFVSKDIYGWSIRSLSAIPSNARKNPWVALGRWGADRNGNGLFDKGPIKSTVRLRAIEVGRYVFYDPIMHTWVRR